MTSKYTRWLALCVLAANGVDSLAQSTKRGAENERN